MLVRKPAAVSDLLGSVPEVISHPRNFGLGTRTLTQPDRLASRPDTNLRVGLCTDADCPNTRNFEHRDWSCDDLLGCVCFVISFVYVLTAPCQSGSDRRIDGTACVLLQAAFDLIKVRVGADV